MLNDLCISNKGSNCRMALKILEHLIDGFSTTRGARFDAGYHAQGDAISIGIHEAPAKDPVRNIANKKPCRTLSGSAEQPIIDSLFIKLKDLLDTNSVLRSQTSRANRPSAKK